MAAPNETLVMEQKTAEVSNSPKNEEASDDIGNNIVNNLKSPGSNHPSKHETYQDGGRSSKTLSNANSGGDLERQRMNADYRHYNQNFITADDYRNAQENHTSNYCGNFADRSNYLADQHGGQADQQQAQNQKMYSQFALRQGYQSRTVNLSASHRPAVAANVMSNYPTGGAAPQQQRFLTGQSISQQGGPTPTLNQLLQSPNPLHRYQNHYGEYNANKGISGSDVNSAMAFSNAGNQHGWGTVRNPTYPQQMYRSQGGNIPDPAMKRGYLSPGQQSSHQTNPQGSQQHAAQYGQQYIQRSYSQAQQQQSPARNLTAGYSQLPAQYNMQQVNTNSQVTQGNFDQRPLSQMASFNQPQGQVTPEVASGVDDDPGGGGGGTNTPGLTRTPATPPTSQGQPLRPPSGSSTGSRSMSPAIGQQANIPMSPRPSSSQSDNNGQSHMTQTQMAAQNYNQQMASTQFYGNKIHQGIMGNSGPMGQYSQQGHYPQGNYPRPQSSLGLQGYGTQGQNSYPSPMNNPNYPSQTGIVRLPPSGTQNYPASTTAGFMNSQYAGPTGYGMMPPPSQYSKSTMLPPGNAQAAAQAAIVAAANSASMRSSPMYLRQHLQQKMYSGSYNSMQQQPGIPNSMPGPPTTPTPAPCGTPNASQDDSPMLPPAVSTPSSSQHSSMSPPSVSTPITETSNAVTSLSSSGFTQTSAPSIGYKGSQIHKEFIDAVNKIRTSTTMTQSIESPVSSAAITVSSPVGDTYTSQQALSSQKRMMPSGFQPPPVLDEGSQASNTSASSSLPEEHATTPKPNSKSTLSHPPTPNTLPSPGAASMSSFHDEFDSVSSPSWPRTPASPRPDGLLKLYDMSEEPDRRNFLDKLIMYNEERGTPITQCPTISKQPLDLYRLYISAKERGGFVEVTKAKQWKDVAAAVGVGASSSAAYTLRKQYIKHLLPYECKFDRGGIDPQPIINQVEAATRKKGKNSSGSGHQEAYPQPSPNQMMDGYPPSNYSGPYPPPSASHTGAGMMTSGDYPSSQHPPYGQSPHHHNQMPNHMVSGSETMNMQDPFAEDIQSNQYQRPTPTNNYSYSQASINAMVPPFSGTQASMSGGSYGYTNATVPQQEQYGDQYSQHPNLMASADSAAYTPRGMVQEPCNQPSSGYPPNRPIRQHTTAQYPYQAAHCDRERYEQPQSAPVMQPTSQINNPLMVSNAMQGDPALYQSQRFTAQQMNLPPRDTMTPQPPAGFQARTSMTPNQYPGGMAGQVPGQTHYSQTQSEGFRGAEVSATYQNQVSCLQTFQRLLSKTPQGYSSAQQNIYGHGGPQTPAKVVTPPTANRDIYQRDVYPPTPKRHMDFMKPSLPDQYTAGSYGQQTASPSPYGDRNQYGYRNSHMMPMSTSPAMQQGWSRETQYRQYQSVYPHPQREGWENARPEGPNTWSHYASSQSESYHPHMGSYSPSLSGKPIYAGRDRMYIPQNKVAPSPGMPQQPQFLQTAGRKEIIFPQESVEATIPLMTKRRRLSSKDVTPLEAWRIMMALKSGLLAESTWALDVLSVLLYDDNTVLYFGLSHLPGLLEVLLEHYRRCLKLIFGLTGDLEVGYETRYHMDPDPEDEQERLCDKKWYETNYESFNKFKISSAIPISQIDNNDKTVILDKENFTQRTRCGKTVKMKNDESLFLLDPERAWDCYEGFESGMGHWHLGGGDMTCHIQTYFENSHSYVKFVRVLEDVVKSERSESRCSDESDLPEESNKSISSSSSDREIPVLENMQCVMENKEESEHSEENKDEEIKQEPQDEELLKENQNEDETKPVLEPMKDDQYPKIRETSYPRKRIHLEDMEDEAYNRDEPSLCVITDSQISLTRRCLCLSTLFRNLSFVPGNDSEMSKHAGFLLLMGRLLLLHHHHSLKKVSQQHYDQEEELENPSASDSCSSLSSKREWWWDMLHILRENTLVTLANITGQLDLAPYPEEISLPLLDGLLHWAVCPSTYAQDPLPSQPPHSVLSPQRLSLEALCKLSILDGNVDLLLATPPWSRIERLFSLLSRFLNYNEDQVLREFSVVLLSNLAQADSTITRSIVTQGSCISQLILFVEQAEQNALQVANTQGINALRKNPELMGTTLDMVRRAAGTLRCLARISENKPLFLQHHQRLLALVMSQILDQGVASIIADVLYECSQDSSDFSSATQSYTKS